MNIDDISKLLTHIDLKAESKKIENHEDAILRRFKEKWLFISTLIALVVAFCTCIGFLLKPDSPYSGIALNGVIGLTMALAGYYVRGKVH